MTEEEIKEIKETPMRAMEVRDEDVEGRKDGGRIKDMIWRIGTQPRGLKNGGCSPVVVCAPCPLRPDGARRRTGEC